MATSEILTKPLPVPDGDTQPFWEGTRLGELRIQRCRACDRFIFYPRSVCPHCMSDELAWVRASGRGVVYSYTVVHRAPEEFRHEVPYVVALVDLEEGVRMMTRLVDVDPGEVRIGMPVEVTFRRATEDIVLPYFRPARGG